MYITLSNIDVLGAIKSGIVEHKNLILSALSINSNKSLPSLETYVVEEENIFKVNAGKSRTGEVMRYKGIHPNDLKISAKDTNGQLSFFEFTGLTKEGPPLHVHFNQDEFFYIVEGTYRFVVGNQTHILKAGDTIFLPRNIPHTFIQLSSFGKLTYTVQPSGKIESFFKTMNSLTKPPTEEEAQKIYLDHDMKIVGPPLSL
jgi:quercetin dioxygenase-like cupin family protein